ncbi:hypothetical protein NL676_031736 [Syzygium grande]|nr:hypothetical protein NL676_031736 [Syzygium grande]
MQARLASSTRLRPGRAPRSLWRKGGGSGGSLGFPEYFSSTTLAITLLPVFVDVIFILSPRRDPSAYHPADDCNNQLRVFVVAVIALRRAPTITAFAEIIVRQGCSSGKALRRRAAVFRVGLASAAHSARG